MASEDAMMRKMAMFGFCYYLTGIRGVGESFIGQEVLMGKVIQLSLMTNE